MKKIFIILLVVVLSSCSSKECSNFNGYKYKVINSLFSDNTEIVIDKNCSPMDLCIIVLDEIIDNEKEKGLKIRITDTNIKFISKEDVLYIKANATKIHKHDNMLSAIDKTAVVVDRISEYKQ